MKKNYYNNNYTYIPQREKKEAFLYLLQQRYYQL